MAKANLIYNQFVGLSLRYFYEFGVVWTAFMDTIPGDSGSFDMEEKAALITERGNDVNEVIETWRSHLDSLLQMFLSRFEVSSIDELVKMMDALPGPERMRATESLELLEYGHANDMLEGTIEYIQSYVDACNEEDRRPHLTLV